MYTMFASRSKRLQTQGFKQKLYKHLEAYLLRPTPLGLGVAILLSPLSMVVCAYTTIKRLLAKPIKQPLPTISVGNLTVGGSGKTPLTIALAKEYAHPAIVLRGYKRQSKGTICISNQGNILTNVLTSGDEAMLYAKSLPNATVIVSEDRVLGIQKALECSAKCVFLDDGFSKAHIQKFDILIRPKPTPTLPLCLPSGPYREPIFFEKYANLLLEEDKDFSRIVTIQNSTQRMVLVTAIANPIRLKPYLPTDLLASYTYADHHPFTKTQLEDIISKHNATSLLVTQKDAVKLEEFGLPLSLLKLDLHVNQKIYDCVKNYIEQYD